MLNFDVIATDSDGDSVQTSLTVNVTDDVPHAVVASTETPLIVDETAGQDAGTNDVASTPALLGMFDGAWGAPIQIAQSGAAMFSTAGATMALMDPERHRPSGCMSSTGLTQASMPRMDAASICIRKET